jgi:hypothetical protein
MYNYQYEVMHYEVYCNLHFSLCAHTICFLKHLFGIIIYNKNTLPNFVVNFGLCSAFF